MRTTRTTSPGVWSWPSSPSRIFAASSLRSSRRKGGYGDSLQNIPYMYTSTGALNHNLPPGINPYTFPIATLPSLSMDDRLTRFNFTYDLGQRAIDGVRRLRSYGMASRLR